MEAGALTTEQMAAMSLRVLRGEVADYESNDALVAGLLRGDARAELEAWNRFSPGVDATLRRLLGPGEDRDDLLQEVFIRFFNRLATLRAPSAMAAFLTGISVHVVQGEIARRRRRRWLRLTATGDSPDVPGPHPNFDAREAVIRYHRHLEKLSVKDRSVFVARTIEGLTLVEVAELHGLSVSTTQRRLLRATKRMALLVRRDPLLANFVEGRDA